MAVLPVGEYFSLNGKLKACRQFVTSENEGGVYEVLRVLEGVPLFMEDHLERFFHSAEIAGTTINFSGQQIEAILTNLIQANKVSEGNILMSCKQNLKAFFIAHNYPTNQMYESGVELGLLHAERRNPNAKVFQTEVRTRANEMISSRGFYEVLLVDQNHFITEGSRSNVFFIRENSLVTPPAGKVLLGITRQKTIHCASQLGITCREEAILIDDLGQFDSVFVTGTSPKILPVSKIENATFDVNNLILRQLIHAHDTMIADYVQSKK